MKKVFISDCAVTQYHAQHVDVVCNNLTITFTSIQSALHWIIEHDAAASRNTP